MNMFGSEACAVMERSINCVCAGTPYRKESETLVQFRKTNSIDIDSIMEILAEGRASLASLGIDQWQGGYPHRGVIEGDVAQGDSFVVCDEDGCIIATAMVSLGGEPIYDRIEQGSWLTKSISNNPCYGVVHRVAVGNKSTGKGTGAFLLASAEGLVRAQGCASVRIDTHPGNAPMRRLLEKCGYVRCGVVYIAHAETGIPERVAYEKLL